MVSLFSKKKTHVAQLNFSEFKKWLHDKYDFTMSKNAYTFLYNSAKNNQPVHILHWSPEMGQLFIHFADGANGAQVEYQITNESPRASQWKIAAQYGDTVAEAKDDFHIINSIRQEFRKSFN